MTFSKEQKVVVILLVLTILGSISIVSYLREQNRQNQRYTLLNEEEEPFLQSPVDQDFNTVESSETSTYNNKIVIHIEGAVKNPGVYYLKDHSRYNDAVNLAGGMLEGADRSKINLAKKIYDEAFIYIPMIGEEWEPNPGLYQGDEQGIIEGPSGKALVNINTATQQELTGLPGIGEVYAQRIIDYRSTYGDFQSIEDIKKVSGIGNVTFDNIKDQITK